MTAALKEAFAKNQIKAIEDMMAKAHNALRWHEDREVSRILKAYDEATKKIIQDLQALITDRFGGRKPNYEDFQRLRLDIEAARIIAARIREMNEEVGSQMEDALVKMFKDTYNRSLWVVDQTTPPNIEPRYSMPTETMIRQFVGAPWRGAQFSQRIGAINDIMARDIQTELTNAMLAGEGAYELGRRIRNMVGIDEEERLATRPRASRAKWRADMIARTEMIRASRLAQAKVLSDNKDIIEDMVWKAFSDHRLCPFCEERDGKTKEEVKKLIKRNRPPGQSELAEEPPAHPHCRCVWIPVPKSWKKMMTKELAAKVKFADQLEMKYRDPETGEIERWEPEDFDEWQRKYLSDDERGF